MTSDDTTQGRGAHLRPDVHSAMPPPDTSTEVIGAPGPAPPILEPYEVGRSTLRTWLISLAGIPAIVVGIDFVSRQRIVAWLTDRIFTSDPQALEPRDYIWAWALIVVGGVVVLWGLKELFMPVPVLATDDTGLHVRMGGPFRPPVTLPWTSLRDLDAGTLEDDGDELEVLIIQVREGSLLPDNPWAGRRLDDTTVALFTREWEQNAVRVATSVADQAVIMARLGGRAP